MVEGEVEGMATVRYTYRDFPRYFPDTISHHFYSRPFPGLYHRFSITF